MTLEQKLQHYRISPSEYELVCEKLGREPEGIEWALFSALWSEHCSYKSSRVHLKKFFSTSERVLEAFGENAGVIDLGEGERVAFKMESHNHPSFIEPYQGAATGVGGILRDIFTMGARPVAAANFLCFGEPKADRMASLVDGVVRGIGGYGNCVGVPTITGQTEFDPSYNENILVNAFALGLFRPGEGVYTSKAHGPGNYVVYVGAKTGRDGVHGASMASESFDEDNESKKPTIQIGDPFFEKLLIESCIEVMAEGLVEAIQDMGAAGLLSSSFEMASKGGVGLKMDLDQVPIRDSSITPEEILLSESQERMLLICKPENFKRVQEVFHRWDLDAQCIGEVLGEKKIQLYWHNEMISDIDPDLLVENAPAYERPYNPWQARRRVADVKQALPSVSDANKTLLSAIQDVRGCSREWVFDQYDQRVGGKTVRDCTDSVAVLRLPDSGRGLGIVLGCRPYMMRFDCRDGAMDAVAYPSLELAAKGFEALGATDCLNYGNPEKPELMTEFVASVEAMSEQCEALKVPVISGNVSLYNETQDRNVTSTPSTGIVGLRDSVENLPLSHFESAGDRVLLLRSQQLTVSGQVVELSGKEMSGVGAIDAAKTAQFVAAVRQLCDRTEVSASRVVGKFGLGYALARMSMPAQVGCTIESTQWQIDGSDSAASLFAENYYEVIVTVKEAQLTEFVQAAQAALTSEAEVIELGVTGGDKLKVNDLLDLSVKDLKHHYHSSWEAQFESLA